MPYYLGIDTSNYTTSLALCSSEGDIVAQKKRLLQVKQGERGLRQSDAVFQHTQNLPVLFSELFAQVPHARANLLAVGCTEKPRSAQGSYMPCFLPGAGMGQALAAACDIPIYLFSHQHGHIMAAAYSAEMKSAAERPFLAFHISGGTTDLMHVIPRQNSFAIETIGTSLDLHAGQLVDRAGVLLGLPFPCGAALEALAEQAACPPAAPKICVNGCSCNLSGAENRVQAMLNSGEEKTAIAAYVFAFLEKTIRKMTENALQRFPDLPVLFAGGVMSNRLMRPALSACCHAYFAKPEFSCDNAAGIALLARRAHLSERAKEK